MTETGEQTRQQIPQRILVLRDFCISSAGASCNRCESACPTGAITLSENACAPAVDAQACTMCGICQGVCDAFTSTGLKIGDVYAGARRIALSQAGRPCILTCKNSVPEDFETASNVISLPCLAMLPAELWAQLLAESTNLFIYLDLETCATCPNGTIAEEVYGEAISLAEQWTDNQVLFTDELPAASNEGLFANLARIGESGERRDAFTDIIAQLKDASSGALRRRTDEHWQKLTEQNERLKSHSKLALGNGTEFNRYAANGRARKIMFPKRQMLLKAIEAQPEIAQRAEIRLSATDASKCQNDLRCSRACPTGARLPDATSGKLSFEARLCCGCGVCAQVCRHDAITVTTAKASAIA